MAFYKSNNTRAFSYALPPLSGRSGLVRLHAVHGALSAMIALVPFLCLTEFSIFYRGACTLIELIHANEKLINSAESHIISLQFISATIFIILAIYIYLLQIKTPPISKEYFESEKFEIDLLNTISLYGTIVAASANVISLYFYCILSKAIQIDLLSLPAFIVYFCNIIILICSWRAFVAAKIKFTNT